MQSPFPSIFSIVKQGQVEGYRYGGGPLWYKLVQYAMIVAFGCGFISCNCSLIMQKVKD
jgi:hypothetical protein